MSRILQTTPLLLRGLRSSATPNIISGRRRSRATPPARLRRIGYWTGSITLSVAYLGRDGWHERVKLTPCQDTLTLIRKLGPLWDRRPPGKLLKVGVVLGDLMPQYNVAKSLFEDDRKSTDLAHIMDQLNGKFGDRAVFFGGMHGAEDAAPTRIAFNHIPEIPMPDSDDADEE